MRMKFRLTKSSTFDIMNVIKLLVDALVGDWCLVCFIFLMAFVHVI